MPATTRVPVPVLTTAAPLLFSARFWIVPDVKVSGIERVDEPITCPPMSRVPPATFSERTTAPVPPRRLLASESVPPVTLTVAASVAPPSEPNVKAPPVPTVTVPPLMLSVEAREPVLPAARLVMTSVLMLMTEPTPPTLSVAVLT